MAVERFGSGSVEKDIADDVPKLPIHANEKFLYAWKEDRWMHVPSVGWRPQLKKLVLAPGVNGTTGQHGKRDPSGVLAGIQREGSHTLMPGDPQLGPYQWYVRSFPTKDGRKYYCTAFEEPTVIGSRVHWNVDESGYWDFCAYLMETGIVTPMPREVLRGVLEREEVRVDAIAERASKQPGLSGKLQAAQARLRAMQDDYERQFGGLAQPQRRPLKKGVSPVAESVSEGPVAAKRGRPSKKLKTDLEVTP